MKKLLTIVLFLFIGKATFSSEYLAITFNDKKSIPSSKVAQGKVTIDFVDSKLDALFSKYNLYEFTREFPAADLFPDTIAQAVKLRLVFRIRILGLENNIRSLQDSIATIKI